MILLEKPACGVGAEVATDYLKFSANTYFGLTGWHQSRDFSSYDERPADGFDIRTEAYLPAYPQLGGKLMYENTVVMKSPYLVRMIARKTHML